MTMIGLSHVHCGKVTELSKIIIGSLLFLPLFIAVYVTFRGQTWSDPSVSFAKSGNLDGSKTEDVWTVEPAGTKKEDSAKLHGGLIADSFNEKSCLSRYESFSYRKLSPHIPSPYLLSRLRNYEDLHKRCGPHTKAYKKSVKNIKKFGHEIDSSTECKYVVWVSFSGLGNRILTIASAFLYALLTNRVLLVDQVDEIDDLFCEPFPDTSWLLPLDFPAITKSRGKYNGFTKQSPNYYGNVMKNNGINMTSKSLPAYLYFYLAHDYDVRDKAFFCEQDQSLLANVPWLILKNNNYIVPSLFMIPSFEKELSKLFPETETVFHHLGRYLFHPTNQVWELITRYYHDNLAHADEKIGIQIRNFVDRGQGPFKYVMDQIISCTSKEKLLPQITGQKSMIITNSSENTKSIAVLMTCLSDGYFKTLNKMYMENLTATGDVIRFYQASHEEAQHSMEKLHNRKALTEMFLLSFMDVLVTSGWSTFGYVPQGLGGLRAWIMYPPKNKRTPDPACQRTMSMEPCFLAPPHIDCKTKKQVSIEVEKLVPHIRSCEDKSWGIKLVERHTQSRP